jgi:hypothetical protein
VKRPRILRFSLLILTLAAAPLQAAETSSRNEEVETCLGCHGDKDASFKLPSGETQSLYVARDVFEKSVHGARQGCIGCHPGQAEIPHPHVKAKDKAAFSAGFKDLCKTCHFENYTKALNLATDPTQKTRISSTLGQLKKP